MAHQLTPLLPLTAAAALFSACLGGGDGSAPELDISPLASPTAPIFQRSPLPSPGASPTASPQASPTARASPTATATAEATPAEGVDVTPVEAFEVTVKEAVNVRARPSTSQESSIVGAIYPGFKAKVIGETRGQEVEPGQGDKWYQVELTQNGNVVRGFVYAAYVVQTQ